MHKMPPRLWLFRAVEWVSCRTSFAWEKVLVDRRNAIFSCWTLVILTVVLPSACGLFLNRFSPVHAICHVIFVAFFAAETFVSILHCASHVALYKPRYRALNWIVPYVLCPFMGQTWNTYKYHHVKHHHVEDNGPNDISSTRGYRRDSRAHFAVYFLRFLFLGWAELSLYFWSKRQRWAAGKVLFGELGALAFFLCATAMNWRAGLAVFIVPLLVMRFGMMAANWGQHAFIQPPDLRKRDGYDHSVTLVDTTYNIVAFNDGYHAAHHNNPLCRWEDLPALYQKRSADHVTFQGMSFGDVWLLLMKRDYDTLAASYVHPVGDQLDKAGVKARLKELINPCEDA